MTLLLDGGADPNSFSQSGFTPLHGAVMAVQPDNVRALLAAGADPSLAAPGTGSPTDLARNLPDGEILDILQDPGAGPSGD